VSVTISVLYFSEVLSVLWPSLEKYF